MLCFTSGTLPVRPLVSIGGLREAEPPHVPNRRGIEMARINDPKKLFHHELGMALGAERKVLATLRKLERRGPGREREEECPHLPREAGGASEKPHTRV